MKNVLKIEKKKIQRYFMNFKHRLWFIHENNFIHQPNVSSTNYYYLFHPVKMFVKECEPSDIWVDACSLGKLKL